MIIAKAIMMAWIATGFLSWVIAISHALWTSRGHAVIDILPLIAGFLLFVWAWPIAIYLWIIELYDTSL